MLILDLLLQKYVKARFFAQLIDVQSLTKAINNFDGQHSL